MVVLDIGAAWGYYSLVASVGVGRRGRVYAFEADPLNYRALHYTAKGSSLRNILAFQVAIAATNGEAILYSSGVFGNSSLYYLWSPPDRRITTFRIRTTKLDDFLPIGDRVDLVKIDIDGGELFALRGMRGTLERNRPIILTEFSPRLIRASGASVHELLLELSRLDYVVFYLDQLRRKLVAVSNDLIDRAPTEYSGMLLLISRSTLLSTSSI
jgi:FkbM family methyltransferase